MKRIAKVLIIEDHPLMQLATKQTLEQMDGINVVGVAKNSAEGLNLLQLNCPDLVFLDYQLPGEMGTQVAEKIKELCPETHVVIFTGMDITPLYNVLIKIGVSGIITKDSGTATIQNLVHCILDNHTMVPLSLYRQMMLWLRDPMATETLLTADEVRLMTLVIKGDTYDQIAEQIHASRRSVDNYLRKIYDKLGVKSRAQAIEKFVQSPYYS
jgi:DNA-binding NarL/FixJ family response regulator